MSIDKVLWHSNSPWASTGYGVQTAIFAPRIRDLGYDLAISAFWGLGGAKMEWDGITVLPADENWGNRLLPAYAAWWADGEPSDCLVITLMDVWVLKNYPAFRQMRIGSWVPVDHDPLPPIVLAYFKGSGARPIAMSRFGQDRLNHYDLDALYVPHGVETNVYRPIEDRASIRRTIGLPEDAFVIGMVANNKGSAPPRKAFPEALEAFMRFQRKHKDAILYLHTEKYGVKQGINLSALVKGLGIPEEAVRWGPQLEQELGISAEAMAHLYSAMDVLLNPSYGEGFGIPIIEAQACGTPVIVTDCTAMSELCGAGWRVGGERYYDAAQGAYYLRPAVSKIIACLGRAYDRAQGMRAKAREFAVGYDADIITSTYWRPVLEELTADVPLVGKHPAA